MKLCWHDWHNHETGPHSQRYVEIKAGACLPISMLVALAHMVSGFIVGWLIVGIIAGLVSSISIIIYSLYMCNIKHDPWQIADRTCLKCNKVEFNFSNSERFHGLTAAAKISREKAREKKVEQANARFHGYKGFWEKANS